MVETFILHSSSPSVRQTWIHEINQILENQRNFLNGDVSSYQLRLLSLSCTSFCFLAFVSWSCDRTCCPPYLFCRLVGG